MFLTRRHCLGSLIATPLLLAAPGLSGCSSTQRYQMVGGPAAPGADARLEVEETEGGNYQLRLDVRNLLPPERVMEGAKMYAVWMHQAGRGATHIGNLDYDPEKRSGKLTTSTPYSTFELTVRPERQDHPSSPSDVAVLRQRVEGKT